MMKELTQGPQVVDTLLHVPAKTMPITLQLSTQYERKVRGHTLLDSKLPIPRDILTGAIGAIGPSVLISGHGARSFPFFAATGIKEK